MTPDIDRQVSRKFCPRFGTIAVAKGFVSPDALKAAMAEQVDDDLRGRPHRMIGEILFAREDITPAQIEAVLAELFSHDTEDDASPP